MTLEKAIILLVRQYDIAKNLEMVINPVAYALYKVWKMADEDPPKRKPKAISEHFPNGDCK